MPVIRVTTIPEMGCASWVDRLNASLRVHRGEPVEKVLADYPRQVALHKWCQENLKQEDDPT